MLTEVTISYKNWNHTDLVYINFHEKVQRVQTHFRKKEILCTEKKPKPNQTLFEDIHISILEKSVEILK